MTWPKRILLFLAVNFLIIFTVSILLQLFNIRPFINKYGISYTDLLAFCFVWGMGGALISLFLAKKMAKWMLNVKTVDLQSIDPDHRELLSMVKRLAKQANLPAVPEVGVYHSPEVNAFATGASKKNSLVAVSSGLLERMNKPQVEGVVAHELAHIANGDMVTMTLLQGVVNAFVMFLARTLALVLSGFGRGNNRRGSYGSFYLFTFLFQMVFMLPGSMVVMKFSRWREFRADAGGAKLAGKDKMIDALEGLKGYVNRKAPHAEKAALQAFKISTKPGKGFRRLFASHPSLDERISRLKSAKWSEPASSTTTSPERPFVHK